MPRKIPSQVPQTVSRLLEAGFLKQPPAWLEAVNNHPPVSVPARHPVQRPNEDLPAHLRAKLRTQPIQPGSSSKATTSNQKYGRDTTNSKKKSRSLTPKLTPKPIVYDEDKIRQQFFRDHPWEAYRPKTLVEMSEQVGSETRVHGDPKRLRSYGRNPSVEDFVACTLAAHREGGLSLSQAYHNTLSSYHGLKAEREHATRYAILEAKYYGADLGKTETQRGFEKEEKALESWAAWAAGGMASGDAANAADVQQTKAARVKRTDQTFTSGDAYLEAAKAFRQGEVSADRLGSGAQLASSQPSPSSLGGTGVSPTSEAADDFLGLAKSAMRPAETSTSDSHNLPLQAAEHQAL
ncbi:Mitochondrial ribosomal protein S25 [Kalmanozyma brasiliensis GHG001]|uniref:Small ribosomal subunit protein mS23 n=1 Tax=Kalmanozyma brasiliensis (strain GHG001) TaxID=1365824 RepID=V5EM98_KALBG|nr:Mitochondrial ribosomal protein S25 [Kalmanozyma brasiliensis GHG001]EST06260.1 Mitochondrial ribosomal protein S25 [Kalmanozyma brasiliensis GHG001]